MYRIAQVQTLRLRCNLPRRNQTRDRLELHTTEEEEEEEMKGCKKGLGNPETRFADRCYWIHNGYCIKSKDEPCLFNIGKEKTKKK